MEAVLGWVEDHKLIRDVELIVCYRNVLVTQSIAWGRVRPVLRRFV